MSWIVSPIRGAFALNAAKGGAASVVAVDVSKEAVDMTEENIRRNGCDDIVTVQQANVFDLLTELAEQKCHDYDFIILDPAGVYQIWPYGPQCHAGGYKEINLKAMRLRQGGYLATCSCSHFMRNDLFRTMLHDAAADAGVRLRQIEERQQAPDHLFYGMFRKRII